MAVKSARNKNGSSGGGSVRSMTGYGRKELTDDFGRVIAEMRSVNGRFLKLTVKTPPRLAAFEDRVRKLLQEHGIRRGSVDVYLSPGDDGSMAAAHGLEQRAVKQYVKEMDEIGKALKIKPEVSWSALLALPGVVARKDRSDDIDAEWERCSKALLEAMSAFEGMRAREGKAMMDDVCARLKDLRSNYKALLKEAPKAKNLAVQRLRERVAALMGSTTEVPSVSREGLEREMVLLADRMDVSEELARLESHFQQMESTLTEGGEVGKKLDFLTQELFREVNTIGSKAQNEGITHRVVEMKGLIEKIREQVQNLE